MPSRKNSSVRSSAKSTPHGPGTDPNNPRGKVLREEREKAPGALNTTGTLEGANSEHNANAKSAQDDEMKKNGQPVGGHHPYKPR